MARRSKDSRQATETLEEIESFFDRTARWMGDHQKLVLTLLAAVLLLAATTGGLRSYQQQRRVEASEAVGQVQTAYLDAMGAGPLDASFTEPANAETARSIRADFASRLQQTAAEFPGSAAAATGRLEAGALLDETGDEEGAARAWRAVLDDAGSRSPLRALALLRLATALEASDLAEASRHYEQAGRIERYPGALLALAQAARSAARAGDRTRALALFAEIEATQQDAAEEASDDDTTPPGVSRDPVPDFILAELRELRRAPVAAEPSTTPATPAVSEASAEAEVFTEVVTPPTVAPEEEAAAEPVALP